MIQRILLFFILIFALAACNRDVDIQANGDGTATITISVTEQEINTIVSNALRNNPNAPLRNPSVDLQNGLMVISGDYLRENGTTSSGTVTLSVRVVNGELQVAVAAASFDGWNATDTRIQEFNEQIARALGGRARQNNSGASLDSVTIVGDNLQIQITVITQGSGN